MADALREVRLLITGGRDYNNADYVNQTLDRLIERYDPRCQIILIQGGARGADRLAAQWAQRNSNRVLLVTERADWQKDGRAAGPRRNQRMLDLHHPDLVVVFPGGKGTADMVRRATQAGVPLLWAIRQAKIEDHLVPSGGASRPRTE